MSTFKVGLQHTKKKKNSLYSIYSKVPKFQTIVFSHQHLETIWSNASLLSFISVLYETKKIRAISSVKLFYCVKWSRHVTNVETHIAYNEID